MRTTLELPEDLPAEAMQAIHTKTKTVVIVLALQVLVRRTKISALKKYRRKADLDIDLGGLRYF